MKPTAILTCIALASATAAAQEPAATECGSRVSYARIWEHIRKLHDKDGDGVITAAEYSRGKVRFANYDRNDDGKLTAVDFPKNRYWNGFGPGFARRADQDRSNTVTGAEWKTLLKRLDPDGDGVITMAEMGKMAPPHVTSRPDLVRLSFDQDLDGVLEVSDLTMLFDDLDANGDGTLAGAELAGRRSPWPQGQRRLPKVGETAPDFDLPMAADPKKRIRLSSFKGKRPVALIFGSYT